MLWSASDSGSKSGTNHKAYRIVVPPPPPSHRCLRLPQLIVDVDEGLDGSQGAGLKLELFVVQSLGAGGGGRREGGSGEREGGGKSSREGMAGWRVR